MCGFSAELADGAKQGHTASSGGGHFPSESVPHQPLPVVLRVSGAPLLLPPAIPHDAGPVFVDLRGSWPIFFPLGTALASGSPCLPLSTASPSTPSPPTTLAPQPTRDLPTTEITIEFPKTTTATFPKTLFKPPSRSATRSTRLKSLLSLNRAVETRGIAGNISFFVCSVSILTRFLAPHPAMSSVPLVNLPSLFLSRIPTR